RERRIEGAIEVLRPGRQRIGLGVDEMDDPVSHAARLPRSRQQGLVSFEMLFCDGATVNTILHDAKRRPLRRMPRRAIPSGACRARRAVFRPGRVERRAATLLVVPRDLEVVAPWRAMPTATCPMPDQESSQVRSA